VPRLRPHVGYPSTAVFLFTLAMIMLGFALWDLVRPRWRALYVLLAAVLFVGVFFSQFYLALAFLTDMLGGLAGAAMVAWIAYQYMDRPSEATPDGP
jgi:membrane-associated phospholipid phosphatase